MANENTEPQQQVGVPPMKLLDLALTPSTAILESHAGSFTAPESQEIVALRPGGRIDCYGIEEDELVLKTHFDTFSTLRTSAVVRFPGEDRDVLAVGSDAGTCAILDFSTKTSICVDLGKTGCHRATPGQYLAVDPQGRALMIAAVEKRKLVYVLNKDAQNQPTLASPLEAHRNDTLCFDVIALDNGYENPIFAALEVTYSNNVKQVATYQLDLGLNHVSRTSATTVPRTACCLAAIPGGAQGPGGLLVGAENTIVYMHDKNMVAATIPQREFQTKTLITHMLVYRQKKRKFFGLAQSEWGDVYKIDFTVDDNKVTGIRVAYLDTISMANKLNVNALGMLFSANTTGPHTLFQFERIQLDESVPTSTSAVVTDLTDLSALPAAPSFVPANKLQNLRIVTTLENPVTIDLLVGELAGQETSPQLYRLVGQGPTAKLAVTRHGASVTELAVSDLPGVPGGIYSIPTKEGTTEFIVVSFADATLVLKVGDTVQEVEDTGLLLNVGTLACAPLHGLVQVHAGGVRHVGPNQQAKQWHCPGLKRIETASANAAQVMVAMAGGEVVYFTDDQANLVEAGTREMGAEVCCLHVGPILPGASKSLWGAIGCRDSTIRIVSLDPNSILQPKGSTALKARPHSVALVPHDTHSLTLVIGLDDGSSVRMSVDIVTGALSTHSSRRFLGARPVNVVSTDKGTLQLSSRPWMGQSSGNSHSLTPLSYMPLDHACPFSSEAVPQGIVATAGNTLRILTVTLSNSTGDSTAFHTRTTPLRYTPRQMTLLPAPDQKVVLAVVESDVNAYGQEELKKMGFNGNGNVKKSEDAMDMDDSDDENEKKEQDDEDDEDRKTDVRPPVPAEPGHWGSCVRLLDPASGCRTLDTVEMAKDEAALCCCSVRFHSKGGEPLLAVGTVTGMTMLPIKHKESHIALFRIVNGDRFQLLHRTVVEGGPVLALQHFQGRLLVGVGSTLRLYEMGKRQLLRKSELRNMPTMVKTIQTVGDRAFVGDNMQSVQIVRYDTTSNRLMLLANDACPRPIACQELLDWNTVAVGDKFGNISVLRLPKGADTGVVDLTGQRALWDNAREDLVPKMELLCQYHVGEVVTSMTRSSLVAGGPESIIYVTVTGRMAALVPCTSRDDVEFYTSLEEEMRAKAPRPTGRDPRSFRSYYAPAMHIVDGTLCDAFHNLGHEKQQEIADKLDRPIGEIVKKLEETRSALL